jgi:hypothetical protein
MWRSRGAAHRYLSRRRHSPGTPPLMSRRPQNPRLLQEAEMWLLWVVQPPVTVGIHTACLKNTTVRFIHLEHEDSKCILIQVYKIYSVKWSSYSEQSPSLNQAIKLWKISISTLSSGMSILRHSV